nr:hypothetical protein BaRGS_031776 [Batillaria attramentaria]
MADHVLSTNSEPKFSRKRKLGKNKKKSWRAVDITETEEFLEDQRFQLRTTEEANTVPKKLSALTLATEEKKANSFTRCQAVKQRKQALQEKAAQLKKKNCLPQFEHDLWDGHMARGDVRSIPTLRSQLNKELRHKAKRAEVKDKKREEKKMGTKKLGKAKYP